MVNACFPSQVIRPSVLPSGIPGKPSPAKETSIPTVSFIFRDVLRQNQWNWFQVASVELDAGQMHEQHSPATSRDKLHGENCGCDIPSLRLATQKNVSLQVARKGEASSTFRDVAKQSAACNKATTTCHATLTSTLPGTFQEMLHCVTLPLNVTTCDGITSRLPYRRIHISLHPLVFQEKVTTAKVSGQYQWLHKIKASVSWPNVA